MALILSLAPVFNLYGQFKSVGVPEIRNIGRDDYGGGTQNWDITADDKGNIYVANNNGVMRFDGEDWVIIPVENNSVVRSVEYGDDRKVYVGAYNEIGVLDNSERRGLSYRSLNHLIPEDARDFDDVWNICQTDAGVVFQSFEYIFIYRDDSIRVIKPGKRFGNSFYAGNIFYVVEPGTGLRFMTGDTLQTVSDDEVFTDDEISALLPFKGNDLIIGTQNNGLYILSGQKLRPSDTEISSELRRSKLYCGSFQDNVYLFGTIKAGLFVTTDHGTILEHLSRSNGLQNNTVLSLFTDRQDNVWLGLDIGIDYLKSSLPLSVINDNFNIAATYATAVHNGRLYVGTNQGLYTKEIDKLRSHTNIKYDLVEGMEGQVWSLKVIDGQLLCGHHNGAWLVDGLKSRKLTSIRGVWNFHVVPGHENLLLSGTYDGLVTFVRGKNGQWEYRKEVEGFGISSKDCIVRNGNQVWVSHGYLGLFLLSLNETLDSVVFLKKFRGTGNLPDELPYLLHERGTDFIVSTNDGIYQYDIQSGFFRKPDDINKLFGDMQLLYLLKEDSEGNIWYSARKGMGVLRLLEDGTYANISTPFLGLNNARVSPFDNIYFLDRNNIFIGTQNGLVHYDPSVYKNYFDETLVYIKSVRISSKGRDSLWYSSGNSGVDQNDIKDSFAIPYSLNSISFRFSSPDMENAGQIEYSVRLAGFDDEWSGWTSSNFKEYTNLREGHYTFEVKAKNLYNNVSSSDKFHFIVMPPFTRSNRALILYFLVLSGLVAGMMFLYLRRIDRVRSQEKIRHLNAFMKREQMLEEQRLNAENEVIRLRNENLQTEMNFKNRELATATYNIIQKNKLLSSLKDELSGLVHGTTNDFVSSELKRISSRIERDIQNENAWEAFDRYFDEVHQEFHLRLKTLHPDLTPGELRLCSYLRMNISTKEIAPLMNISFRGVEISRYRLRKKLRLDRSVNVTEYLMNI